MPTKLQYHFVASDEAYEVLTVGLADSQFDTREYLWFQRSLDSDEDEGIYIERNGQQYGTYGGIEKLVLSRDKIKLRLSKKTAEILETDQEVLITFSSTNEQFEKFQDDLKRVFESESILEVN
jgi:hypothetical protein